MHCELDTKNKVNNNLYMEEEAKIEQVNEVKQKTFSKSIYVAGAVIALAFLIVGYLIGSSVGGKKEANNSQSSTVTTLPPTVNSDPRVLLDPIEILKSPIFTEWSGSVEGKVISKDTDSFVIEKNGRQLTVYLQQTLSGFYKESESTEDFPAKIEYEELSVGDTVRGAVTVSRATLDNELDHHVFANVFTVVKNVQSN